MSTTNLSTTKRIANLRAKYCALKPAMDERVTRLWAGAEAESIGPGGISMVAEATGMSRTTIRAGRDELRKGVVATGGKVRRAGAGRPSIEAKAPAIVDALERLIEPVTRSDPKPPLRWTPKSLRRLAAELTQQRFPVSPQKVGQLLRASGYSLQGAQKTFEVVSYAVCNEQFRFLRGRIEAFQSYGAPVIAVDSINREFIGDVRHRVHKGQHQVRVLLEHSDDVIDTELGEIVLDVDHIAPGWMNVDADQNTPAFTVRSIVEWWASMGLRAYPAAKELLIAAGRVSGSAAGERRWQTELQHFADHIGLEVSVSHRPPATSKWSKIEHRLRCYVVEDRPGSPVVARETLVQCVGSIRRTGSPIVETKLSRREREHPTDVSRDDGEKLLVTRESPPAEWNYTIYPHRRERSP